MAKQQKPAPAAPIEVDDAGDPELTPLEVQHLLEKRDAEADTEADIAEPEKLAPDIRAALAVEKETGALHQLDLEPAHSKIVVVSGEKDAGGAFLGGPSGTRRLPNGDVAHKLPIGARIRKLAEDMYMGEQLNAVEYRPPLVRTTAAEVIAAFVRHFHAPSDE